MARNSSGRNVINENCHSSCNIAEKKAEITFQFDKWDGYEFEKIIYISVCLNSENGFFFIDYTNNICLTVNICFLLKWNVIRLSIFIIDDSSFYIYNV